MTGDGIQVLPAGAGYGIVIGVGVFFALIMFGITALQNRFTQFSTHQAEEFNTASRSVKPGLIAAGIVSSWTWSATLLTSSSFAYWYGVCGPMWYAAMGTLQITLFALIAIKIKASAAGAHTFPEIIRSHHGKVAHATYLFFGLVTNILVGGTIVLGGSQVVAAMTGMNTYAAIWLIPAVVGAYVVVGGLRSTFIADYAHSLILFIAIFVFGISIYSTNEFVGSPSKMYDLLVEASKRTPVAKNHEGSYLTFKSINGLVFAIDLLVAGFSTVWLDQAYWQRAIASKPETSVKAYLLGGIAWYGIPFSFASAMGLGAVAMTTSPSWPTYPDPLTQAQSNAGLASPATAIALLGKGGAGLMLLLLFMAVTSSTSAELIAVSSLLTFDVYKAYLKPQATSEQLVRTSHYGIGLFAMVLSTFCSIMNAVDVSLTWLLTCLGIIVGGASIPAGLILLWPKRMSTVATIGSPWISFVLGLIAWFVTTQKRSGSISVDTTGDVTNAVAGNVTSWAAGAVFAVILSLLFPGRKYEVINSQLARPSTEETSMEKQPSSEKDPNNAPTGNAVVDYLTTTQIEPMDPVEVKKAERVAKVANVIFLAIAVILVPFTLFGTEYIYSRSFFYGWCVVSFMWVWSSMVICVIWPLWESRHTIWRITRGLVGGNRGNRREEDTA